MSKDCACSNSRGISNIVVKKYHDNPLVIHGGIQKAIDRLKQKYVVANVREKVEQYRNICVKCHDYGRPNVHKTPICKYPIIPKPFHEVHKDLMGTLPVSYSGDSYIIVFVVRFTRNTVVGTITDKTAISVAHAVLTKLICEYTMPTIIFSDNGKEF